jgi:hypothetical protein
MEITTTKENLIDKLNIMFQNDFKENINKSDLDEDEKYANTILSRKKILEDSENIANLVFRAFE